MAAPTLIEFKDVTENGTPASIVLDNTPTNGQLLFAFVQTETQAPTITPPTGFTLVDSQIGDPDGQPSAFAYYKVASSESSATYVWASDVGRIIVRQYVYSGAGTPEAEGKNTSGASTVATINIANGSQAIGADTIAKALLSCSDGVTPTWTDSFTAEFEFRWEMQMASRTYVSSGTAQPIPIWVTGAQRARSLLISIPSSAGAPSETNLLLLGVG